MPIVGEILVQLDGVFDLRAAERIAEVLSCVGPGGALRIDLSQIREFHDAGVAVLARTLKASGRQVHVVLSGLRQHQARILGYLGVDVEALEALPAGSPG
jgi:anti-anti-sigma regulatory factor